MGIVAAKNEPGFWMFPAYKTGLILWLAGGAVTDVLITSVLIWHLVRFMQMIEVSRLHC